MAWAASALLSPDGRRILLCAAVVVIACALATEPLAAQEVRIRRELESRRTEFERAISDNDTAAVARLYTPDALLFPPGAESIRGRDAIKVFFDRPRDYEIGHDISELQIRGDTVLEFGRWTRRLKQGSAVTGGGWYFWLWQRQQDGSWLIDREIWSSTPAP